jgi:trans-aconitate methyltransferase
MILDSRAEYEKGVLSLLDRDSYASLLDLGCSYGGFTKAILERVKPRTACAIDMQPDKAMLSR